MSKHQKPQNNYQKKLEKTNFPYDPAPMTHSFPGQPEDCFDLVNQYGTYNIQPTADTENFFPAIAQGLPRDAEIPNRPQE